MDPDDERANEIDMSQFFRLGQDAQRYNDFDSKLTGGLSRADFVDQQLRSALLRQRNRFTLAGVQAGRKPIESRTVCDDDRPLNPHGARDLYCAWHTALVDHDLVVTGVGDRQRTANFMEQREAADAGEDDNGAGIGNDHAAPLRLTPVASSRSSSSTLMRTAVTS